MYKYHAAAQAAGTLIIPACGFDSIPGDMGALFAVKALQAKGANPSSVELFLTLECTDPRGPGIHFATYHSAVLGFASVASLRALRQANPQAPVAFVGKRLRRFDGLHFFDSVGKYCLPFMGADPSIVRVLSEAV